jgi:hypothetical protein
MTRLQKPYASVYIPIVLAVSVCVDIALWLFYPPQSVFETCAAIFLTIDIPVIIAGFVGMYFFGSLGFFVYVGEFIAVWANKS